MSIYCFDRCAAATWLDRWNGEVLLLIGIVVVVAMCCAAVGWLRRRAGDMLLLFAGLVEGWLCVASGWFDRMTVIMKLLAIEPGLFSLGMRC